MTILFQQLSLSERSKFLESHKISKLIHKEIENLKRLLTNKKIKLIINISQRTPRLK